MATTKSKLIGVFSMSVDADDPQNYLRYNVFMVRTMGLLRNLSSSHMGWIVSVICNWVVWTTMSLHFASELCDVAINILDLSALTKNVTVTGVIAGAWIRYTFYTYREKDYFNLVDTVSKHFVPAAFTLSPQRCSMARYIRQSRLTFIVYFIYGSMVAVYWCCHPMFSPSVVITDFITNTSREVWEFPCGAWYPFDATKPYIHPLVYIFQCVSIVLGGCTIMVTDMMFITLSLLLCGQLEILKDTLRFVLETASCKLGQEDPVNKYEIISEKKHGDIDEEINIIVKWCVQHHNMLLSLITNVESLHWLSMLVNFSLQLVILSFLAFEATTATDSNPMKVTNIVSYLILAVLQLFLLCRSGDQLMDQAASMAEAVYESQWYDCPASFKRSLRIIVLRSRQPVKVTAGKIAALDLDTFSETLSRAFSYFTVLRQIRAGP